MKKLLFGLSLSATLFITNSIAVDSTGKDIFDAKGCSLCHKKDFDTIGPSLKTIAIQYTGKESSLLSYLKGEGDPIVDPSRSAVMNPQLLKIRTLFESDMRALGEYIVSAADRPI